VQTLGISPGGYDGGSKAAVSGRSLVGGVMDRTLKQGDGRCNAGFIERQIA